MKLDYKIRNVRTLVINTEYSIINCLPCELTVHFSRGKYKIKKCSQYYIDNNSTEELFFRFSIFSGSSEYTSTGMNISKLKENEEDNYIEFKNNKDIIKLK